MRQQIRITRPEVYADSGNPGDLENRQGYYSHLTEDNPTVAQVIASVTLGILSEAINDGECVDVQDWPSGEYIGRFRKNREGQVVQLHRPSNDKLLAFCYHEEHGYAWSFEVDPQDTAQDVADEAIKQAEFEPDYIWIITNDDICPMVKEQFTNGKHFIGFAKDTN